MNGSETSKILIVDDSPATLELLLRNLSGAGFDVFSASSAAEALDLIERQPLDLVITDLKMPKVSGLDLVRHVRENLRDTEVMMITGYATVESAVEAMKEGASEYLAKPFTENELLTAVQRVLERQRIERLQKKGMPESDAEPPLGMIGGSRPMQDVYRMIARASRSNATVLITGESGTGKELAARAIHYSGPRASAPFVPVNLYGVPETLVESALFGHVRGAFTGANETRAGFFQTAEGGTIFLDEVSEIPPPIQVKLLRVLQEREFVMVGATRTRNVDVRIVAASNRDLLAMVRKGLFREDLYFRLNVIPIALPPLRDRREDIPDMVLRFAARFAEEAGLDLPAFEPEVIEHFMRHDWPGNVRELENVVQQLVVMTESDRIGVPDLPAVMRFRVNNAGSGDVQRTLEEVEREHIRNVLTSVNGNKTRAAGILGIDRKTLRTRLKHFDQDGETSA